MSCRNPEDRCCGGSILGTLFLLFVAAVVIASLPEIKRYIKISTM